MIDNKINRCKFNNITQNDVSIKLPMLFYLSHKRVFSFFSNETNKKPVIYNNVYIIMY